MQKLEEPRGKKLGWDDLTLRLSASQCSRALPEELGSYNQGEIVASFNVPSVCDDYIKLGGFVGGYEGFDSRGGIGVDSGVDFDENEGAAFSFWEEVGLRSE